MKRARLLGIGVALVTALFAAFVASKFVPQTKEVVKKDWDTLKVLVADKNIDIGQKILSKQLRWQVWPADAVSAEFITNKNSPNAKSTYSGSIARTPFIAGEPIKKERLVRLGEGGVLAAILPSGMRALSVPIKDKNVAGGFILPNDRVDVILSRRLGKQNVSETLLSNIRVLAVGKEIQQKDGKKTVSGKTATLELSPRQVEIVSMADAMGEISLSLRSLADASKDPNADLEQDALGRGSTIKMLKYGVQSRAFGVN